MPPPAFQIQGERLPLPSLFLLYRIRAFFQEQQQGKLLLAVFFLRFPS
jgi:hypothetical protein